MSLEFSIPVIEEEGSPLSLAVDADDDIDDFSLPIPSATQIAKIKKTAEPVKIAKKVTKQQVKQMKISGIEPAKNIPVNDKMLEVAPPIITASNLTSVKLPATVKVLTTQTKKVVKTQPKSPGAKKVAKSPGPVISKIELDRERLERSTKRVPKGSTDAYDSESLTKLFNQVNKILKKSGKTPLKGRTKADKIKALLEYDDLNQ